MRKCSPTETYMSAFAQYFYLFFNYPEECFGDIIWKYRPIYIIYKKYIPIALMGIMRPSLQSHHNVKFIPYTFVNLGQFNKHNLAISFPWISCLKALKLIHIWLRPSSPTISPYAHRSHICLNPPKLLFDKL